jgi:hypothetical protein
MSGTGTVWIQHSTRSVETENARTGRRVQRIYTKAQISRLVQKLTGRGVGWDCVGVGSRHAVWVARV